MNHLRQHAVGYNKEQDALTIKINYNLDQDQNV
jgi:hypothetical protein